MKILQQYFTCTKRNIIFLGGFLKLIILTCIIMFFTVNKCFSVNIIEKVEFKELFSFKNIQIFDRAYYGKIDCFIRDCRYLTFGKCFFKVDVCKYAISQYRRTFQEVLVNNLQCIWNCFSNAKNGYMLNVISGGLPSVCNLYFDFKVRSNVYLLWKGSSYICSVGYLHGLFRNIDSFFNRSDRLGSSFSLLIGAFNQTPRYEYESTLQKNNDNLKNILKKSGIFLLFMIFFLFVPVSIAYPITYYPKRPIFIIGGFIIGFASLYVAHFLCLLY